MPQVHILPNRQALRILITQNCPPRRLGLADDIPAPHVVEEAVVDAGGVPGVDALGAAEGVVADEGVATAVVGRGVVVGAVVVLLGPVELEIRKAGVVEAAEEAEDVGVVVELAEVIPVFVQRAGLVPALRDSRVVLPFIEEREVGCVFVVDGFEGEVLCDLGDVAAVDYGTWVWLGAARGVAGVDWLVGEFHRDLVVLGHDGVLGQWLTEGAICAISHCPDGARACGRRGALPECAAEDEEVVGAGGGLEFGVPLGGVLDSEAGGEEFGADDFVAGADEGDAEVLVCWVSCVDGVDHVPDLA